MSTASFALEGFVASFALGMWKVLLVTLLTITDAAGDRCSLGLEAIEDTKRAQAFAATRGSARVFLAGRWRPTLKRCPLSDQGVVGLTLGRPLVSLRSC